MTETTHKIELPDGYTDSQGTRHTSLTFARRVTGADLFDLEARRERLAQIKASLPLRGLARHAKTSELEGEAEVYVLVISEFGTLKPEQFKDALMRLTERDFRAVRSGFSRFEQQSAQGRAPESLGPDLLRLGFGLEREGVRCHLLTFGRKLLVQDLVWTERASWGAVTAASYLAGRQVSYFSTDDGARRFDGPLSLADFRQMDAEDVLATDAAVEAWRELGGLSATEPLAEAEQPEAEPEAPEAVEQVEQAEEAARS